MTPPTAFFEAQADRYDAAYDAADWGGRFVRARMAAVLAALEVGPGDVLDAGMGGGRLVGELDARGWRAHGVDSSPRMVELARRRLPTLADRLRVADLSALPYPPETFDAVVATGVIEYVEDLTRGLEELHRVLRPGGKAALSFPNYHSPHALWRRGCLYPAVRAVKAVLPLPRPAPLRPLHPIGAAEFMETLVAAGFRSVASRPIMPRFEIDVLAPQFLFEARK